MKYKGKQKHTQKRINQKETFSACSYRTIGGTYEQREVQKKKKAEM